MPFKSQAQRGKFYAMAERGEISPKVVSEWEHATPKGKKLPKHVKKSRLAYELGVKMAMFGLGFPVHRWGDNWSLDIGLPYGVGINYDFPNSKIGPITPGIGIGLTGPYISAGVGRPSPSGLTFDEAPKGKKEESKKKESKKEESKKEESKKASASRDMPHFTDQDRPDKVKEIYGALKREHPGMPAEMKARIAARQGKKGKQHQGPPYRGPLAKESHMSQTSVHERLRHYLVTGQPLEKSSAVRAELASILKSAGVERGAARVAARAKPAKGVLERAGKSIGKTYDTAKKKVSKNVGKVKKTVGEGYDVAKKKVGEGYGVAKKKVGEGYEVAKKKVGEGYEAAKEQGSRVGGFVKRHPYATGLAALGTAGVGGAGYALGSRNNSQKEAQLGTAFTDGFLHYCLENELSGDQVATMLEKGASLPGQVGNECRGLVDRMLNA